MGATEKLVKLDPATGRVVAEAPWIPEFPGIDGNYNNRHHSPLPTRLLAPLMLSAPFPRLGLLIFTLLAVALPAVATAADSVPLYPGLTVTVVSEPPSGPDLKVAQPLGRKGPTSFRYFPADSSRKTGQSPNPRDPNGGRYPIKDRDIGQTFTAPPGPPFRLESITVRVGPASFGSIAGAAGAEVFVQLLEVSGSPRIDDNTTTEPGLTVSKGYPGVPLADDFIRGEIYRPLLAATGGVLPDALTLGEGNTHEPTAESSGTLLRFTLPPEARLRLEPGRVYAFLFGFVEPAPARALPLDNWDYLNLPGTDESLLRSGPYAGGHALRREGAIEAPYDHLEAAFTDEAAGTFPPLQQRLRQQPSTWGRPDVDTYRDLVFWLTGQTAPAP